MGGWDDRGCINPPCLRDRGQRAPTRSWSRVSLSAWSRYKAALHEPMQDVWQSRPLETLVSQNSGRPATGLSAHAGAASLLSFLGLLSSFSHTQSSEVLHVISSVICTNTLGALSWGQVALVLVTALLLTTSPLHHLGFDFSSCVREKMEGSRPRLGTAGAK